ncbi:MAG: hypothetical protein NVS9B6_18180 [Candidatus Limnocylindrales bacterium]
MANGYCVKCKASREIKDAKAITMKNGRPATQGTCPVCGTKIFKIGASDPGTPVAEKASPAEHGAEHSKAAAPEHDKA